MQIMYGVAGERRLTELELPWLPGYESSRPVRVGNGAHAQLQLDVFGEVMDALHQAHAGKLSPTEPAWEVQRELLAHLAEAWEQPDYGIWEVRGPPLHFTYSKIMAWVAFDRASRAAFGWRMPTSCAGARRRPKRCSNGFSRCATMSACLPRSSILRRGACLAISTSILPRETALIVNRRRRMSASALYGLRCGRLHFHDGLQQLERRLQISLLIS